MLAQFNSGGQSGRLAACAIAGCLTLTACANTANMSPAQRAIAESNQRLATTTAEGAVVGALGGAVVGFLATGKVQGALIGAGAGGVVGAAAGYMVAQNNYRRSRSQADLQAAIADANRQANEAWQEAGNAQRIADEARVAAAKVGAQYRAGQITLAEYHSRLATYQQSITDLQAANKRMAIRPRSCDRPPGWRAATEGR